MEAKNFRPRNLVKSGKGIYRIFAVSTPQILAIQDENEPINSQNKVYPSDNTIIEPYQIKRDTLVQRGFKEVYKSDYRIKYDYEADVRLGYTFDIQNGFNYATFLGVNIPCKYYHELQNLFFALTGTELNLKNGL